MTDRLKDLAREATLQKALELLEGNRVMVRGSTALVSGESGFHKLEATQHEVICDCEAGRRGRECSHRLAAMVAWQEHALAPW